MFDPKDPNTSDTNNGSAVGESDSAAGGVAAVGAVSGFGLGVELGVVADQGAGGLVALANLVAGMSAGSGAGSASGGSVGAGVGVVSDEVLVGLSDVLESAQRALDSARLTVVGELDARNVSLRTKGLVMNAWLGHEYLLSRPVASRMVSTARKLRSVLPEVAEALRNGLITLDHAALLSKLCVPRVEPIMVALQAEFISLTTGVRFEQWANEIRALIDLADPDGAHLPNPDHNRINMSDGLSGELHLDGDFVADTAATIRAALLSETERRVAHHRKLRVANPDHIIPSRPQLLAEALTELIRRAISTQPGTTNNPATDITLVIQASDPVHASTPDGVRLQDGTTRLLNCDPKIQALIINSLGIPLDLGTAVRYATPNQRKAIAIRDQGCIVPGCDAPHNWVDLHHVEEAQDGGPTDLNNLVSLCKPHHALLHTNGWTITENPDKPGRYIITTPTGTQLNTQHNGKPSP